MGLLARKTAVLLGGAAFAVMVGVSHGWAQDTSAMEAEKQGRVTLLQRLVVGAGVEKVAIDTPQSVTVVEQEDIDVVQATTIGEVLRTIPGVNTGSSDRMLGQSFNIRGIGGSEMAGEEGRIILNVDGAVKFYEQYRLGNFFSDTELYKRVEVLRGPASSTLYGSGALGGVINFTTKDASDFIAESGRGALKLKGSYDSNGQGWLGSAVLAHRFSENLDLLLTGNFRTANAFKTGDGTSILSSEFDTWSGLAKATAQVGDEGTLRMSYQHWDSDAQDQDYIQIGGVPSDMTGGTDLTIGGFGTVDRHVVDRTAVASYENPFSDNDMLDLKFSASYSSTRVRQDDATGIPGIRFVCPMIGTGDETQSMFCDTDFAYNTWQLKVDNTSTWQGDNWVNHLTYGVQTSHQTRQATAYFGNGTPFGFGFHPEGTDFKAGIYAQNEFIWNEKLTLIPGARLDWRKLAPGDKSPLTEAATDVAFSPKIAAHYKFNDAFAVFGSYAHTERFPTLDETFQSDFAASYGLKKERSDNFELGFASSFYDVVQPGDGLQLKLTGFYNNVHDLIASCRGLTRPCGPDGTYIEHYMNIEDARIYGAEFELAYDSDYVFASASYAHTIGKNINSGEYLTTVAPHEFGLTVGAKLPEHGLRVGWRSRFVASPQDERRRSDVQFDTSTRYATSFNVHDVYVSWRPEDGAMKGWEVIGGIDNVFNTQYKEFLHNEASKGRTFKLALSKQFDY